MLIRDRVEPRAVLALAAELRLRRLQACGDAVELAADELGARRALQERSDVVTKALQRQSPPDEAHADADERRHEHGHHEQATHASRDGA